MSHAREVESDIIIGRRDGPAWDHSSYRSSLDISTTPAKTRSSKAHLETVNVAVGRKDPIESMCPDREK
jgi:hypothetical protein